jgi:hypothetical protein
MSQKRDMGHGGFKVQVQQPTSSRPTRRCLEQSHGKDGKQRTLPTFPRHGGGDLYESICKVCCTCNLNVPTRICRGPTHVLEARPFLQTPRQAMKLPDMGHPDLWWSDPCLRSETRFDMQGRLWGTRFTKSKTALSISTDYRFEPNHAVCWICDRLFR